MSDRFLAIIVMGVSGAGKSTVAAALRASRLQRRDADVYHPPSNIAKMHAGIPLTDDDRWPWLHAIADAIDRKAAAGTPVVIACSALKRAYRDVLVHGRDDVRFVYLKGSRDLIAARLVRRSDHFMPTSCSTASLRRGGRPPTSMPSSRLDAPVDDIVGAIVARLSAGSAAIPGGVTPLPRLPARRARQASREEPPTSSRPGLI